MSFLILPTAFPVVVETKYLFNLEIDHEEPTKGKILALEAYALQPVTAMVLLENGGSFHDLPLEAFLFKDWQTRTHRFRIPEHTYCDSPSEDAKIDTLPLPSEVKVFRRNGSVLGVGTYLHTITWAKQNELLHVIILQGNIILWPPHKLLFGSNTQNILPPYKKWRQYDNILGI